ncbi:MAG: hypothetical protein C0478_02215 [Planctomyces sp.]|nr:hypothetical protein [Planctomyces sp.]
MKIPSITSPTVRGAATSAVLHAAILFILSLIVFQSPNFQRAIPLSTIWEDKSTQSEVELEFAPLVASAESISSSLTGMEAAEGGATVELLADLASNPEMFTSEMELNAEAWDHQVVPEPAKGAPLAKTKRAGKSAGGGKSGLGQGVGGGIGNGRGMVGSGIFSSKAAANKVVFVVDCSLSMNAPHLPSTYRTGVPTSRFQRVQLELVQAVQTLPEKTEFFIVFFSDEAFAMPSRGLQPASYENKEKYLKWVATSTTMPGQTDPRSALLLALRLEPEVIYLLTDGSFRQLVQRDLLNLKQPRTAVNTIALGEAAAEPILKQMSEQNRGTFSYVP